MYEFSLGSIPDERMGSIVVRGRSRSTTDPEIIALQVAEATIDRFHLTVEASFEIWDTISHTLECYAPTSVCILRDSTGTTLDTLSDVSAGGRYRMRIVDYCDQLRWDALRINFASEVLEEFQGYKIVNGTKVPHNLTVGTSIIVDIIAGKVQVNSARLAHAMLSEIFSV